jgi:hypothetical protein
MTYNINKTNGDLVASVAEHDVDTSTSIRLVGKNFPSYGEIVGEDMIAMLEHFSNPVPPLKPIAGQLWYNSAEDLLYLYDINDEWRPIYASIKGTVQRSLKIKDINDKSHFVIVDYANGIPVMVISGDDPFIPKSDEYNINAGITVGAFPLIKSGINLSVDPTNPTSFKLNGYATSESLQTAYDELKAADAANATRLETLVTTQLRSVYPIGTIYTSTVNKNPSTFLGFGTWVAFGAGRVLMGQGSGYTAGTIGGSTDATVVNHSHNAVTTITDRGHAHVYDKLELVGGTSSGPDSNWWRTVPNVTTTKATTGITASTTIEQSGSPASGANMQPYVVVYMWNRTA